MATTGQSHTPHWTEEQLIAHLYGTETGDSGAETQHLGACEQCRRRLQAMRTRWTDVSEASRAEEVDPQLLAEQRRAIYARLEGSQRQWGQVRIVRWASAGVATVALSAGLLMFSNWHQPGQNGSGKDSDVELAAEVSSMSLDTEAQPAAPLKALFE